MSVVTAGWVVLLLFGYCLHRFDPYCPGIYFCGPPKTAGCGGIVRHVVAAYENFGRSSAFLQLGYHAIDVECRVAACLGPELLEHVAVFCFQRFLASLGDHTTLDPHLRSFSHCEIGALRDVERGNLGIAGAQALVEEWLDVVSLMSYTDTHE